ncbi:MAG: hypothetical protein AB7E85_09400 [Pseudobdellovibrionaceae bacterium]
MGADIKTLPSGRNLDQLIASYDVRNDPLLKPDWPALHTRILGAIASYDREGAAYGQKQLLPHLQRIAEDGHAFLLHLGQPEHVAYNFADAYILSDLGKIHDRYDPAIWSLPHRPTDEERQEKRLHPGLGPEVIEMYVENQTMHIKDHPHIALVIPSLMCFHHERLDGTGPYKREKDTLGLVMQVAILVDVFDGDRIPRAHQDHGRTPEEALDRMAALGEDKKYEGAFDPTLLQTYRDFKLTQKETRRP